MQLIPEKEPMWDILEALSLIRQLQPLLRPFDFHVALGGGVLNKGSSTNDLDLYILPVYKDRPFQWNALEQILYEVVGRSSNLLHTSEGPQTRVGACFRSQRRHVCGGGKVIDVFVVDPNLDKESL